jgi:hypothetical protein
MNPTLSARRFYAKRKIDEAAGEARARYLTDIPGQTLVYLLKLDEARAFIAGAQAAGAYVVAESEATGLSKLAASEAIVDAARAWNTTYGPQIEKLRIKAKQRVQIATGDEIAAIVDAAVEALNAL